MLRALTELKDAVQEALKCQGLPDAEHLAAIKRAAEARTTVEFWRDLQEEVERDPTYLKRYKW
jgi:phytoene/squalene synthetase